MDDFICSMPPQQRQQPKQTPAKCTYIYTKGAGQVQRLPLSLSRFLLRAAGAAMWQQAVASWQLAAGSLAFHPVSRLSHATPR